MTAPQHAYGAALDNPDLVVASVIADGEAETGPLATRSGREDLSEVRGWTWPTV